MNFLQKPETKITVIFLLISSCWIVFSDMVLANLTRALQIDEQYWQTRKGLLFILIVSFVIYLLIKKSSAKIQRNFEEYKALFEGHPAPMWIYDTKLKIVKVNNAAVNKYGYAEGEFLNMTIEDITPREDIERLNERIETMMPGYRESGVWKHIKKNGDTIYVNITSHDVTFNKARCMLVMAEDISELIKTREELMANELSLSVIINNTKDVIWYFDKNHTLLAFNKAFVEAVKKTIGKEPHKGERVTDLYFTDYDALVWNMNYSRVLKGESFTTVRALTLKDEQVVHIEVTFNPIINEKNEISGAVCFSRDVTEKQKQEEKIRDQNSALKEIAFTNSHLVRRPLSNILGLVDMLEDAGWGGGTYKEVAEKIKISATELDNIIRDIAEKANMLNADKA